MNYPKRKLPRLSDYDYSTPGTYFVTFCTHNKQCIFGNIVPDEKPGDAHIHYSPAGKIARNCLLDIESHYDNVKIENWVIMPNHIHLLVQITERKTTFPAVKYDIPNVIGKYKAAVTRAARSSFVYFGKLWQSSFYDHIIRNDEDYQNIWQYISGNPSKWLDDCFYCE